MSLGIGGKSGRCHSAWRAAPVARAFQAARDLPGNLERLGRPAQGRAGGCDLGRAQRGTV